MLRSEATLSPGIRQIIKALKAIGKKVVAFDGSELAAQAGTNKALSAVMMGAAFESGLLPFDEETILQVLKENVPEKTIDTNMEAFRLGREAYKRAVS